MKLRTKFQDKDFELGEVADVDIATMPVGCIKAQVRAKRGGLHTFFYQTKAEFDADWEDAPEEPNLIPDQIFLKGSRVCIDYKSVEAGKKALEKLKAWTRLEDSGLKFKDWNIDADGKGITISASYPDGPRADLDLLFGGEK